MKEVIHMGNKKFDEFYFENDKDYPDTVYWKSFALDRAATEKSMIIICSVLYVN